MKNNQGKTKKKAQDITSAPNILNSSQNLNNSI